MSSEIGLNDVKPGMWVEFDDADGHYAGELHEMKNPESMVDVLIMSMGHKPPLYIETEDEGNLVVFLDFGDGYSTGSARNVHVYESKPETESVKQAEDDDKKPFWKGKTCGELEGLRVKITWNNGDTMTSTLDMVGNVAHCVSLSPAIRSSSTFVPYSGIKSIELVDDAFRERITDITKVRPGDKVVVKNGNEYTVKKTDSDRVGGLTLCLSIGELGFPDGWWVDDSFSNMRTADRTRWMTFRRSRASTRLAPNRCGSMTANVGCRCSPMMAPSPPPSHASPNPAASSSRPVSGMIVSRSRRWRRASSDFHPEAGLQVRQMPVGSRGQDHAPPMPHMRCR